MASFGGVVGTVIKDIGREEINTDTEFISGRMETATKVWWVHLPTNCTYSSALSSSASSVLLFLYVLFVDFVFLALRRLIRPLAPLGGPLCGSLLYVFALCLSLARISSVSDYFAGNWRKHQQHGKGKLTWTNGNIFEGEWMNGDKRDGTFREKPSNREFHGTLEATGFLKVPREYVDCPVISIGRREYVGWFPRTVLQEWCLHLFCDRHQMLFPVSIQGTKFDETDILSSTDSRERRNNTRSLYSML